MFAFFIRRATQAVFVMLVISLIGFTIKQSVGDAVREITGISVSAAERDALREKLGLNDPFPVQWGRFLVWALQGDLGNSFYFKRPALQVILGKAPATLELVFATALLVVLLVFVGALFVTVNTVVGTSTFRAGGWTSCGSAADDLPAARPWSRPSTASASTSWRAKRSAWWGKAAAANRPWRAPSSASTRPRPRFST